MAEKCLIFTYGLLQPSASPPRTASNFWRDRLRATMFDLGAYPVAVKIGRGEAWIDGFVIEIDADELADLDEFEDTDSGEFVRKTATTEQGYEVYVYEFGLTVPAEAPQISVWSPKA